LVWTVSAATGAGLQPLVRWLGPIVREFVDALAPRVAAAGAGASRHALADVEMHDGHATYRPRGAAKIFTVSKEGALFLVRGRALKRLVSRFDVTNEEAIRYLGERLDRLGVYSALRAQGAQPGDDVDIEGHAFEYH
jgi:GTPase